MIDLQIKGNFEWPAGEDWMHKANDMEPAPFSNLFGGEPDGSRQRISRDLKLLDAVFAMGRAAYDRMAPASPWADEDSHSELSKGAKAVQKLVHVALQRMCAANLESQDYFGRRTSRPFGAMISSATIVEVKENDLLHSLVAISHMLTIHS